MDVFGVILYTSMSMSMMLTFKLLDGEKNVSKAELLFFLSLGILRAIIFSNALFEWPLLISYFIEFAMTMLAVSLFLWKYKKYTLIKSITFTLGAINVLVLSEIVADFTPFVTSDSTLSMRYLGLIVMLVTAVSFIYVFSKIYKRWGEPISQNKKLQLLFFFVTIFTHIALVANSALFVHLTDLILFRQSMFFALIHTIIFLVSFVLYGRGVNMRYEAERIEIESQAMTYYTTEIEKQFTNMRKFKHDYENILASMDSYFREDNYEQLKEYYYSEVKVTSNNLTQYNFSLENLSRIKVKAIKSILATKLMIAHEEGITFNVEVKEEIKSIPISLITLVRMLGIILDNAIEELATLGEGKLMIGVWNEGKNVTFVVQNTCRSSIEKVHELEKIDFSTKGEGRGIGLSNLSELVGEQTNVLLETSIIRGQFIQKLEIGG